MRMTPGKTLALKNPRGTPLRFMHKGRAPAKVQHFNAPLKGLSRYAELGDTDMLQASILTNWVVEDDRITVRPGYIKIGQLPAGVPCSTMIPFYGEPKKIAIAGGAGIYDTAGALLHGAFGSDDW